MTEFLTPEELETVRRQLVHRESLDVGLGYAWNTIASLVAMLDAERLERLALLEWRDWLSRLTVPQLMALRDDIEQRLIDSEVALRAERRANPEAADDDN